MASEEINPKKASLQDMQRELHNYAMDEMRNRGLNAALSELHRRSSRFMGRDLHEFQQAIAAVRSLRTDPSRHLSDWWGQTVQEQEAAPVSNGDHA